MRVLELQRHLVYAIEWHVIIDLAYNWAMADNHVDRHVATAVWRTCRHHSETGAYCVGRQADGFDYCLAHLGLDQLDQALQRLRAGAKLDASGIPINAQLLVSILHAVQSEGKPPIFGAVSFAQARFTENATFTGVRFSEEALFEKAEFTGGADFEGTEFAKAAEFGNAKFTGGEAWFIGTRFTGNATFQGAHFADEARFDRARFIKNARFERVTFGGEAVFEKAEFAKDARFGYAEFADDAKFGEAKFTGNAYVIFDDAQFSGFANFNDVHFAGDARFDNAQFTHSTRFTDARFTDSARFKNTRFTDTAWFRNTRFNRATFDQVQFAKDARFAGAWFTEDARFDNAQFAEEAEFASAQFTRDARFEGAKFKKALLLGPLSAGSLSLQEAEFVRPLVIEAAAARLSLSKATSETGVTLRLRYAEVDLDRTTLNSPSSLTGIGQPLKDPASAAQSPLNENYVRTRVLNARNDSPDLWVPVLASLDGVDAATLSVSDVDLSQCRFAGARHLDLLRLEGRCIFAHPPPGLHAGWAWLPLWRWSNRQSIIEEGGWRTTTRKRAGWQTGRPGQAAQIGADRLAVLYRQLRKAQEDAKNEPGAADFYYGEMDMRRHAATTPAPERIILWLYWLISGYGLRALRSLAALGLLGVIVTTVLVGWGLAANRPAQHLTGTVTTTHDPARIEATLRAKDPRLPPAPQRWTSQRTRAALQITTQSIVFRSTAQPLTAIGTWITMAARILGPVLLALSVLAVRSRVKR